MLNRVKHRRMLCLLLSVILLFSFKSVNVYNEPDLPYRQAGLNERQAAAHLLDRFTFGAKPGQVDDVVKMGLERWFLQQLNAGLPDQELNERLSAFPGLTMSNEEIVTTYRKPAQILRMAIRDGVVDKDAVKKKDDNAPYKKALTEYMRQHGFKPQRALYHELISQKILRAAYSHNQLQEVLTSFWFNHFNVSLTDNDCARFIVAYERDAIRTNVLGKFSTMLLATAKSPAMLTYLDNFRSSAADDSSRMMATPQKRKKVQGLNENYAREIMELHTLGVDAGYTQTDVTEAARIFTGWTIYPGLNDYVQRQNLKRSNTATFYKNGFVREGDFLFAANKHDRGEKIVLGEKFRAGGGFEEGVKLIEMLAYHPATARFISQKLAVRFVSDNPPESLVDKMAKTFTRTEGDLKAVLLVLVSSPEFWSKEALREKIKTPFELAISSVRSLNAEITDPQSLYGWVSRMGERMYAYQAPTGFPDKGQYWINTGSLLTRMNFGLALASHNIRGIQVDLASLNENREPESVEKALAIYGGMLLPERALDETINRLLPAINNPEFTRKINSAASSAPADDSVMVDSVATAVEARQKKKERKTFAADNVGNQIPPDDGNNRVLAQVVGLIIGSPEFQRK